MDASDIVPETNEKRTEPSREEVLAARKLRKENKKKRKRSEDDDGDRPLPEDHHCSYWMPRKRRYCNLSRHLGALYCTDHLSSVDGQKRIPCPIDPRHHIYEADLDKHIKWKCPALKILGSGSPWFSLDANAGDPLSEDESDSTIPQAIPIVTPPSENTTDNNTPQFVAMPELPLKTRHLKVRGLGNVSPESISALLQRLEGIWAVHGPEISSELIVSEIPPVDGITAPNRLKHLIQNEAIISHLKNANMWDPKNLYIEWGGGNAKLSQEVQHALHSDHIIVDRKTPKVKGDVKRDRSLGWKRITIDIKDIKLDGIPEVSAISSPSEGAKHTSICSFSKHLCGAATDLTIRCLEQHHGSASDDSILIALCCHHRCAWRSYVGRSFFEDDLGLSKADFELMTRLSSWATSGSEAPSTAKLEPTSSDSEDEPTNTDVNENAELAAAGGALSLDEKTRWGWKCKRILDVGRMQYLRQLGYIVELKYYVPQSVSLENILLVCRKPKAEPQKVTVDA